MKVLSDLLYKSGIEEVKGGTNRSVNSICFDSRQATRDSMFVATRGSNVDGHLFIDATIKNGSIAIVCEEFPNKIVDAMNKFFKCFISNYIIKVIFYCF